MVTLTGIKEDLKLTWSLPPRGMCSCRKNISKCKKKSTSYIKLVFFNLLYFFGFERIKSSDTSHAGGIYYYFVCCANQTSFLHAANYFSQVPLILLIELFEVNKILHVANRLELIRSTIQPSYFPNIFVSNRILQDFFIQI
jgi:hypothetical protein